MAWRRVSRSPAARCWISPSGSLGEREERLIVALQRLRRERLKGLAERRFRGAARGRASRRSRCARSRARPRAAPRRRALRLPSAVTAARSASRARDARASALRDARRVGGALVRRTASGARQVTRACDERRHDDAEQRSPQAPRARAACSGVSITARGVSHRVRARESNAVAATDPISALASHSLRAGDSGYGRIARPRLASSRRTCHAHEDRHRHRRHRGRARGRERHRRAGEARRGRRLRERRGSPTSSASTRSWWPRSAPARRRASSSAPPSSRRSRATRSRWRSRR